LAARTLHGVPEQAKRERTRYYLAAELRRSGEVMGDAGFEWIDREQGAAELGYFLAGPPA
jgi:RimJ/RimL family protein N-acetyltransferase